MSVTEIREELYHFIEAGDAKLIKMLHAVAKEYSADHHELSEQQGDELDRRLERYDAGQMKFSSWESVKGRIRNKS